MSPSATVASGSGDFGLPPEAPASVSSKGEKLRVSSLSSDMSLLRVRHPHGSRYSILVHMCYSGGPKPRTDHH
ncbi:hypothetical protein GCM10010436_78950 [Paractinoplanes durhamensis]